MKYHEEFKQSLLKAVEEIIDSYEFVDLEEENKRTRVPENIKMEECGSSLRLISLNGKCTLEAFVPHGGIPIIGMAGTITNKEKHLCTTPLYLEPCRREDLKCGDIAYRSLYETPNFRELARYCVILNDKEYAYWFKKNMKVSDVKWDYWYRVVKG